MKASEAKTLMEDRGATCVNITAVVNDILVGIRVEAIRGGYMVSDSMGYGPKVRTQVVERLKELGYYICNNNGGGINIFWDREE